MSNDRTDPLPGKPEPFNPYARFAELEHMNGLMRDHAEEMKARIAELEAERDRLRAADLADPSEITAAVLAEREACAKIVRDYGKLDPHGNGGALAEQIVAAIRARAAPLAPSGE